MNAKVVSDQALVKRYLQGDPEAIQTLITRHKNKVYTSIILLVRNEALAEDIFQDTFLKVLKTLKAGKYNEEGKFLPWVMRIAHNLAIDHFRKLKRTPVMSGNEDFDIFDVLPLSDRNAEENYMRSQSHSRLRTLIDMLPREQKEVLVMRHYGELSFKEIAEITGVSINTALGRMRYALNNLRKVIEEKQMVL